MTTVRKCIKNIFFNSRPWVLEKFKGRDWGRNAIGGSQFQRNTNYANGASRLSGRKDSHGFDLRINTVGNWKLIIENDWGFEDSEIMNVAPRLRGWMLRERITQIMTKRSSTKSITLITLWCCRKEGINTDLIHWFTRLRNRHCELKTFGHFVYAFVYLAV
jgi:hypothetical protein